MKAGFYQTDITPEDPSTVFLDGYGSRLGPAQGVRDPIYAKVCWISGGDKCFAVFSVDFCGFSNAVKDRLLTWICFISGVKREQIALCATHTHAGPVCGVLTGLPVNTIYLDRVGQLMGGALKKAMENAVEGEFRCAFGDELTIPYNRRGHGHTEIDRRVFVWGFYDASGTLRGAFAGASCHAVCSTDMRISADYPGVMTARLSQSRPGVPVLFLQGRAADVDPSIYNEEGIVKMGAEFADSVQAGLSRAASAPGVSGDPVFAFGVFDIPLGRPDRADLEAIVAKYSQRFEDPDPFRRRFASVESYWALSALADGSPELPSVPADLQALRIGDAAMVFVPFEMLTVTGNALEDMLSERGVKAPQCLVLGYSNGTNGYLCPSAEADSKDYESGGAAHWYGLPQCSAETEKAVISGVTALADRLFN